MNTPTAGIQATTPLSRHRSVWEVRTESWIELVDELSQLANPTREQGDREARVAHVHELTEILTPIEVCWAYPGRRAFADCVDSLPAASLRMPQSSPAATT